MNTNMGTADRVIRILVGVALIAFGIFGFPSYGGYAYLGWFGLVPLFTALFGWCPVYALFGVDTCGRAALR